MPNDLKERIQRLKAAGYGNNAICLVLRRYHYAPGLIKKELNRADNPDKIKKMSSGNEVKQGDMLRKDQKANQPCTETVKVAAKVSA